MKQDTRSSTESSGITRRDALARTAGLVIAGVSGTAVAGANGAGQGRIGTNAAANGIELIAEIGQLGDALTAYGYFTLVNGLSLEEIYFPGTVRDETTARFTFYGAASVASIQTRDTLIVAIASGHVDYFLRDVPGAGFDIPTSFAQGQHIAADDASLQNVLNVTAPGIGVTTVFGDLSRTVADSFLLGGRRYQLGRVGLRSRLVAPGKSRRIEPVAPTSVQIVAGNITNPD
ncbi:MAG TPA: hypothetical protein VJ891_09395 [Casimicrobiaceae bacterium]|nr:hypothetical protein [Casimicrobiaceae bacterium]